MKTGRYRYKYCKQLGGKGSYAEVEIELRDTSGYSIVTDDCHWETMKESYNDFQEFAIHKKWKQSAIKAAESVLNKIDITKPVEIIITDIIGIYADTTPVNVGVAVIIGVFDLLDSPLNADNIKVIDDFVTHNNNLEKIPDFNNLGIATKR